MRRPKLLRFEVAVWEDHAGWSDEWTDDPTVPRIYIAAIGWTAENKRDAIVLALNQSISGDCERWDSLMRILKATMILRIKKCRHCGKPFDLDLNELLEAARSKPKRRRKKKMPENRVFHPAQINREKPGGGPGQPWGTGVSVGMIADGGITEEGVTLISTHWDDAGITEPPGGIEILQAEIVSGLWLDSGLPIEFPWTEKKA